MNPKVFGRWLIAIAILLPWSGLHGQERDLDVKSVRFGEGRVAEITSGKRPSAPDDSREWLILRLNEVGVILVSEDGKSEILAIDKYGGVYLSGDLYVNGNKIEPVGVDVTREPRSQWPVLVLFILSVLTSVAISMGLKGKK